MKNPVVSEKSKYDGRPKATWNGDLVDQDDLWSVVFFDRPAHTVRSGAPARYALRYYADQLPLSILVSFDELGRILEYQCDAALPANFDGRRISFVDLDLDLMVGPEFDEEERDMDSFAINRFVMGYPETVVQAAHSGIAIARDLIAHRAPPFDGSPAAILGRVLASQGPV